jgi:hypothetical protein
MKRKFFLIFPLAFLSISLINLIFFQVFEFLLWLFATVLVSLVFLPIVFKAEEKDVPVYQVFAPILLIPVFFGIFAYMDFSRIDFLNTPQVIIYSVVTGIGVLGGLLLIIGKNSY